MLDHTLQDDRLTEPRLLTPLFYFINHKDTKVKRKLAYFQ